MNIIFRTKSKIILTAISIAVVSLILGSKNNVHAAIIYENITDNSGNSGYHWTVESYTKAGEYTGTTTGAGDPLYLALKINSQDNCVGTYIGIREFSDGTYGTETGYSDTNGSLTSQPIPTNGIFAGEIVWGAGTIDHLTNGKFYKIQVGCSNSGASTDTQLATDNDNITSFFAISNTSNAEAIAQLSQTITILTLPYLDQTPILDFQNWSLNWEFQNVSSTGIIGVHYSPFGQSTTTWTFDDHTSFSEFVNISPLPIPKTHLLNPIVAISATSTWYAQPYYTATTASGTITYTGQIYTFVIDPTAILEPTVDGILSAPIGNLIPLGDIPSSTAETCGITHLDRCLINGLTGVARILFQPDAGSLAALQGAITNFENVPPFSLVFQTFGVIKNSVSSSTGDTELSIPLPVFKTSGYATTSLTIVSTHTLNDAFTTPHCNSTCAADIKANIFAFMTMIIWLMAGFATIKIIKS